MDTRKQGRKARASDISRGLGDAGYDSLVSSGRFLGRRPTRKANTGRESDFDPILSPERGFTSEQDGDAALVRYFGSHLEEDGMLDRYTAVLENLGYQVVREPDPERGDRTVLRVTRP